MAMMGLSLTGQVPFHTVYLHGLVRDAHGQKMSKTKGNVIDPIEVMDEFGTDALRFTLLTGSTPGNDMNLSIERIEANRNFANKIWNAARFLIGNLEGEHPTGAPPTDGLALADRWILSRLHHLIAEVNRLFDGYQYGEAGRQIYDFLWSEYADWYIEISKNALYGEDEAAKSRARHILAYVLDMCLRMLHPYVPFVTEEIWGHIPHEGEALMLASWPEADDRFFDAGAEDEMGLLMGLIRGIRNARAEYKVDPSRRVGALIEAGDAADVLDGQREAFTRLANVDPDDLRIAPALDAPPEQAATATVDGVTVFLPLAGMVDLTAERERIRGELADVETRIAESEKLLANEGFTANAPEAVVQRERDKLADLTASRMALTERLAALA
jgi:valyl-tRNA synthetase